MKKVILIALLSLWQPTAWSMDLAQFLKKVESQHKTFQSLDASIEAAEDRRLSGDADLAPVLSLTAKDINDKKEPNQLAQYGVTESRVRQYSLGLDKKFSTGTSIGLSANAAEFENVGLSPAAAALIPPGVYLDKYGTASLGVSISQSLWKDFLGNATRLRAEKDAQNAAVEKGQYDLQKKNLQIAAEAIYWDYVYSLEDLKIRQSSLERSKKIEQWTTRRMHDGISDRADLLQTQALVAQKQLQLLASRNSFQSAQKKMRDFLELGEAEPFPDIQGNIAQKRPLSSGGGKKIVQLESYVASLNAKAKAAIAKTTEDANKPDLVLSGAYNTNGYDATMPKAVKKWDETDKPTTVIGLSFRYAFGTEAKDSVTTAARKDALAAQLQSERKMLEGESAWSELVRQYNDLGLQIELAQGLSKLQTDRAKAQVDKFNKGRSITTDVVNAEEDAANAELNLTKLMSEQRKLEAQGRLFVAVEEAP